MPDNDAAPPKPKRQGAPVDSNSVSVNGIRDEVVVFHRPGVGNVVAVLPMVPEDAPYRVREGIARRRVAAITGTCTCGATVDYHAAKQGTVNVAEVMHERLCPADTDRLAKAVRWWAR